MKKGKAKSKAKSKAESDKTSKRPTRTAGNRSGGKCKDVNPADVRRDIRNIVGNQAKEITQAVVVEARKGQLATAKYLFEAAGIYPAAAEGAVETPEEDTLAQRLVRRLGLPAGPLPSEEDEDAPPVKMAVPVAKSEEDERASSSLKPGEANGAPSNDENMGGQECLPHTCAVPETIP